MAMGNFPMVFRSIGLLWAEMISGFIHQYVALDSKFTNGWRNRTPKSWRSSGGFTFWGFVKKTYFYETSEETRDQMCSSTETEETWRRRITYPHPNNIDLHRHEQTVQDDHYPRDTKPQLGQTNVVLAILHQLDGLGDESQDPVEEESCTTQTSKDNESFPGTCAESTTLFKGSEEESIALTLGIQHGDEYGYR